MKLTSIVFEPEMFIDCTELETEFARELMLCGNSGSADAQVAYIMENYDISGDVEDCKAMLRPYGAWEEDELNDHNTNLSRLVWLLGCNLNEEGESYFSGEYA